MIALAVLLLFLTQVDSMLLKGCSDSWPIDAAGNICKLQNNYSRLDFPRPTPCHIQPEFRVQEVVDINEEHQTITLVVKFVLKWNDDRISYHFPTGQSEGVYHPWYLLDETLAAEIWIPNVIFPQSVFSKEARGLPRGSFWYKHPQSLFLQTMERLTLACQMTFSSYPFDSHSCSINLANFIGKYSLVVMNPLKVYSRNESGQSNSGNKLVVHDQKLRFDLTLTPTESITNEEFGSNYSWAQVDILLQRKSKESKYLWGSYFASTLIFAVLSLASFCIQVDMVPGRIGLLITLFLISINNYNSLNAPSQRGISFIEIWFIGMEIPMIGAILEYALILCLYKYKEKLCNLRFINYGKNLEAWTKNVDFITLCISLSYIILFNVIFWCVCYFH